MSDHLIQRVASATPPKLARRIRGVSDRTIALLFVTPTILLLLAVNIFPADLDDPPESHEFPYQPTQ